MEITTAGHTGHLGHSGSISVDPNSLKVGSTQADTAINFQSDAGNPLRLDQVSKIEAYNILTL